MKHWIVLTALSAVSIVTVAQDINKLINNAEVTRIEKILSDDRMQGREAGTKGGAGAASFIADEFKNAGLAPGNQQAFLQPFSMVKTKVRTSNIVLNGNKENNKRLIALSPKSMLQVNEKSGYEMVVIKAGGNLGAEVGNHLQGTTNKIILVDSSYARSFERLNSLKRQIFNTSPDLLFILGSTLPTTYLLEVVQEVDALSLQNVVGILPGKSRKNEYVIFSGHFDHLGITNKPVNGDSIYNGANDDAAGITAVILLARYFKALGNNERTIVFAAFDAEEIGGFGSQYFSKQFNPQQVTAMFNIEMIGTESKWGKNSAYITGYEKTDMGKILEQNLKGSAFSFHPDPYTDQQLFYRSDNATLARLGVPAHTISTSKMDSEANYHQLSDDISTLDIANMTEIIKAIAISSTSIINGKDTPSRVNTAELK